MDAFNGAALDEIVPLIDDTADQVRVIATTAEEQSAASEQINQSVNNVISSQAMHEAAQARVLTEFIEKLTAS